MEYEYEPSGFFVVAFRTKLGQDIWEFLTRDDVVKSLIDKAQTGRPAIETVGSKMKQLFGDRLSQLSEEKWTNYGSMTGQMIYQILQRHGFQKTNVRKNTKGDPLFNTGMTYKRVRID